MMVIIFAYQEFKKSIQVDFASLIGREKAIIKFKFLSCS